MKFHIIRAGTTDIDNMLPLFSAYRQFYCRVSDTTSERRYLESRLQNDQAVIFIACEDGSTLPVHGFVLLYPSFDSVELGAIWVLHDLFVSTDHRKCGVGRLLMEAAHDFCRASGAVRVDLTTAISNVTAQPLYESMGYERDKTFYSYSLTL